MAISNEANDVDVTIDTNFTGDLQGTNKSVCARNLEAT